jgi:hypothetical protein
MWYADLVYFLKLYYFTHELNFVFYQEEDDEDNVENILFPKSLVESN